MIMSLRSTSSPRSVVRVSSREEKSCVLLWIPTPPTTQKAAIIKEK